MRVSSLIAALLLAQSAVLPAATPGAAPASVPENDFVKVGAHIRKVSKDTSAVRAWMEKALRPLNDPAVMLSRECLEYSNDVSECIWGYEGSITEAQLRKKWGQRYDTSNGWEHPFENGNCGWASRKLVRFEHLGELNGGDWFFLEIRGGCGVNDFSESLSRVVKVENLNGRLQITNLLNPRQN